MSIQRYNVDDRGRPVTPTRSGYWVKFKDHAAALAAQAERVKELEQYKSDQDDFMVFMHQALADMPCCHEDSNQDHHAATPPMMWPELIGCIAAKAVKDIRQAAELAKHKIEQTLEGQYSDGQALRAALGVLTKSLGPKTNAPEALSSEQSSGSHSSPLSP